MDVSNQLSHSPAHSVQSSANDQVQDKLPNKRRSPIACQTCRSRKVRCDVSRSGGPCTNCRLDKIECKLAKKRRYGPVKGKIRKFDQVLCMKTDLEDVSDGQKRLENEIRALTGHVTTTMKTTSVKSQADHTDDNRSPLSSCRRSRSSRPNTQVLLEPQPGGTIPMLETGVPPSQPDCFHSTYTSSQSHLPNYIKSCQVTLNDQDQACLHHQGAFDIPTDPLRNKLLQAYLQFVYPFLPVINISDFLDAIHRNDKGDSISLCLFQAIMFTATAFVDEEILKDAGFQSRKEARYTFFTRVNALCNYGWEDDRLTLVQILLHLTLWDEELNTMRDPGVYLASAINISKSLGLHNQAKYRHLSRQQQSLSKRIWWSCYNRDCLMSLAFHRTPLIHKEDYTVSSLVVDQDYELKTSRVISDRLLDGCPLLADDSKMAALAFLHIALTELCLVVTPTMRSLRGMAAADLEDNHSDHFDSDKSTINSFCEIFALDAKLDSWRSSPTEWSTVLAGPGAVNDNHDLDPVITLHTAVLRGIQLLVQAMVHRTLVAYQSSLCFIPAEFRGWSIIKVKNSTDNITKLFQELSTANLTSYLPSIGLNILVEAITSHLLCVRSSDLAIRQEAISSLHLCFTALDELKDIYGSAEKAYNLITPTRESLALTNNAVSLELERNSRRQPDRLATSITIPFLDSGSESEDGTSPSIPSTHGLSYNKETVLDLEGQVGVHLTKPLIDSFDSKPLHNPLLASECDNILESEVSRDWLNLWDGSYDDFLHVEDERFLRSGEVGLLGIEETFS